MHLPVQSIVPDQIGTGACFAGVGCIIAADPK
ncbi:MAG: hypothetical protein ACJA1E_000769, partial [Paracoccaceae bacterium]